MFVHFLDVIVWPLTGEVVFNLFLQLKSMYKMHLYFYYFCDETIDRMVSLEKKYFFFRVQLLQGIIFALCIYNRND